MWKPYLKVFAYFRKTGRLQALQLLDRFHIAKNMNKAIDKVRATEAEKLKAQGNRILTNSRWSLLKRPENRDERQEAKLGQLETRGNLATYRAYLLKESSRSFWEYVPSPGLANSLTDGVPGQCAHAPGR